MPISYLLRTRARANDVYDIGHNRLDHMKRRRMSVLSRRNSTPSCMTQTTTPLSADEMAATTCSRGKANCNSCHLGRQVHAPIAHSYKQYRHRNHSRYTTGVHLLRLGKSRRAAESEGCHLHQNKPDSFGFTANPFGLRLQRFGIGTFLRSGPGSWPSPNDELTQFGRRRMVKCRRLRRANVALVPPQCPTTEAPGPYFQKEFFHNG